MKPTTVVLSLIAASGLALAATVALAQGYGPGYGMGPGGMRGAGPGAGHPACAQLVTTEERLAFHDRMVAAGTSEERLRLITEHRAEVQRRAAAQGIECAVPQGGGYGPGMMGGGYGRGMMGRGGQGGFFGGGPGAALACAAQLFTVEEQTAFRDQVRAAVTFEERQALMTSHRTEAQRRASERGVQCPGLTS